jgi:hypothetical protein
MKSVDRLPLAVTATVVLSLAVAGCSGGRSSGSASTPSTVRHAAVARTVPTLPVDRDPRRIALGRVFLTVPDGFHVESQETVPSGGGITARSLLIRASKSAVGGARCQVADLTFPPAAFPVDTRPRSLVRIVPVDGSPAFDMERVEGSDTDLGLTIATGESFSVDCDDVSQARFVASHVHLAR